MRNLKFVIPMIGAIAACILMYEIVDADASTGSKYEPFIVNTTAYTNPNGNLTASGRPTVEGRTVAAKKEWMGCVVALYEIDDDGSIGKFIGYREVEDTGYGKDSNNYKGMGTIESGECIDIFWGSDREGAIQYGEHKVYAQIIPGKG